jgi:hypothetical protein
MGPEMAKLLMETEERRIKKIKNKMDEEYFLIWFIED